MPKQAGQVMRDIAPIKILEMCVNSFKSAQFSGILGEDMFCKVFLLRHGLGRTVHESELEVCAGVDR